MFSSRFWLGVIVGIIITVVLLFILDVNAADIREKVQQVFGGAKAAHEVIRPLAAFIL